MKWKVIQNAISPVEAKFIYDYCKEKAKDQYIGDPDVPNTPSYYGDPMFRLLQKKLQSVVEKEFKLDLFPTYVYWRMYKIGDMMRKHTDRESCEISVSLHIGHEGNDWTLNLDDDGKLYSVILEPGDILLYKGIEIPHWRDELKDGDQFAQAFLHYVDQNGPFKEWKYDKRAVEVSV